MISSITKLAANDLKRTYETIRGDFGFEQQPKTTKTRIVYPPVVTNMINSFRQLITLLFVDPSVAEDSYEEFDCKSPDKMKIEEVQNYIYIIKSLATSAFAPTDLVGQETKLLQSLFSEKKIGEAAYTFGMDAIAEIQANSSYSIAIRSNKRKCVSLVEHINVCFNEIMASQIRHDIAQGLYKDEALANAKAELEKLNDKINNYKKHKKTKYHIA